MSAATNNKRFEGSSAIVDEILELRKIKSEYHSLLKSTEFYKQRASTLEVELSVMKAKLMAKDYELSLVSSKQIASDSAFLNASLASTTFSSPAKHFKLNSSDFSDRALALQEENSSLKLKIQQEHQYNLTFERQLHDLGQNLSNPEHNLPEQTYIRKIKELQELIDSLTEEIAQLKSSRFDIEPVKKDLLIKDIHHQISIESWQMNSTLRSEGSICIPNESNGVPRFFPEESLKKSNNPEPPQTRCNSGYPKRALSKPTKHIHCNLPEILSSPSKSPQRAVFCPNSMRKPKS